ncbi:HNH endonuclease [Nocardiopsis sp. FR26]|uniref:HNH endonuclease n=1 Tax=Nocardiopsis sp. FR26 TaxID=2605987 RepID=UPI00351A2456
MGRWRSSSLTRPARCWSSWAGPHRPVSRRPCLDCGVLTRQGSRCGECGAKRQAARDQQRGSSSARGLGYRHRKLREIVLADSPPCHWCGDPATTADHLVPRSLGGSTTLDNYVPSCRPCNSSRQDNPDWIPPNQRP